MSAAQAARGMVTKPKAIGYTGYFQVAAPIFAKSIHKKTAAIATCRMAGLKIALQNAFVSGCIRSYLQKI